MDSKLTIGMPNYAYTNMTEEQFMSEGAAGVWLNATTGNTMRWELQSSGLTLRKGSAYGDILNSTSYNSPIKAIFNPDVPDLFIPEDFFVDVVHPLIKSNSKFSCLVYDCVAEQQQCPDVEGSLPYIQIDLNDVRFVLPPSSYLMQYDTFCKLRISSSGSNDELFLGTPFAWSFSTYLNNNDTIAVYQSVNAPSGTLM